LVFYIKFPTCFNLKLVLIQVRIFNFWISKERKYICQDLFHSILCLLYALRQAKLALCRTTPLSSEWRKTFPFFSLKRCEFACKICTGETPFRCSYCPKAFTRKDHLVNHVRQHTGESPHKCQYCTKSFTRKEHLTNHVRQHTGESPHRCHFCSKSFTRKEHLTNHVRIHTGESPHRCEFCQRTFTRKEHLNNHLRQHTGDSSHCCNVCSKPFTRKVRRPCKLYNDTLDVEIFNIILIIKR